MTEIAATINLMQDSVRTLADIVPMDLWTSVVPHTPLNIFRAMTILAFISFGLTVVLFTFLHFHEKRKLKKEREKERTRQKEAEAQKSLFNDEDVTTDPIQRELEDK